MKAHVEKLNMHLLFWFWDEPVMMFVATWAGSNFIRIFWSIYCQVVMIAEFHFTYILQHEIIIHWMKGTKIRSKKKNLYWIFMQYAVCWCTECKVHGTVWVITITLNFRVFCYCGNQEKGLRLQMNEKEGENQKTLVKKDWCSL